MWLFTVVDWFAVREGAYIASGYTDVRERIECRVYRGELNDGLKLLKEYSDRFKAKGIGKEKAAVMEFRLLAIQQLPNDTSIIAIEALGGHEISREAIEAMIQD